MAKPTELTGGTEFGGEYGPAGVPIFKTERTLTAAQKARLERLTGTHDPTAPISMRVWNGEPIELTTRQKVVEEE